VAHDSAGLAGNGAGSARRMPQDRLDDHAAIDRLTDELLPALVAKLGANGLGEIEVREGTWRVRLRMPADGHATGARRVPGGRQGSRAADGSRGEYQRPEVAGTAGSGDPPAGSGPAQDAAGSAGASRLIATSPAVGFFRPKANLRAGTKVRAGDRIGSVDVLGIGQDLVAPGDGLIGATLVAPGEPVEYGQAIIVLEQLGEPRAQGGGAAAVEDGNAGGGVAASGPGYPGPAQPSAAEPGTAQAGPVDSRPAAPGLARDATGDPAVPPTTPQGAAAASVDGPYDARGAGGAPSTGVA
jgi:biotin carboxyl carrier protein